MKQHLMGGLWFAIVAAAALAQTNPGVAPDVLIRQTAEEILVLAAADKRVDKGDTGELIKLVEVKVAPHFDFDTMTRLAVGRHWREASAQQRQALAAEFRKLLLRTYTGAYAANRGVKTRVKPLRPGDSAEEVTVNSELILPNNAPPVSVDYDLRATANGWKIYNVTVEGVSLVTTYRSEFNEQIRKTGVDGLIRRLQERNRPAS
ncbi:MAG: phospholipid-binding protein MlaC [Burkholderiales bacterium]